MKDLYYRDMLRQVGKHKRLIALGVIVCMILAGYAGYHKGLTAKQEYETYQTALQEFQDTLPGYDEAITNAQTVLEETQSQLETQQTYCDNSELMKIDAQNEAVASFQRQFISVDGTVQNNIIYAMVAYAQTGSFIEDIAATLDDMIQVQYLKELVRGVDTYGNVVTITVIGADEEKTLMLAEKAKAAFDAYEQEILPGLGECEMISTEISVHMEADTSTENTQKSMQDTLISLQNAVANAQSSLSNAQTSKNNYITNNQPEEVYKKSRVSILIQYMILGGFIGGLVALIGMMVYYMTGVHLHYKEELEHAGWDVLSAYDHTKTDTESFGSAAFKACCLQKKKNSKKTALCYCGETEILPTVTELFRSELQKQEMAVEIIDFLDTTEENIKNFLSCDSSILLTAAGYTKLTDMEQYKTFCSKYDIEMWGCIFVG